MPTKNHEKIINAVVYIDGEEIEGIMDCGILRATEREDMEELEKCPFCGGLAKTIETFCKESGYHGFYIHHNCDVLMGKLRTGSFDTEGEAVRNWNQRA